MGLTVGILVAVVVVIALVVFLTTRRKKPDEAAPPQPVAPKPVTPPREEKPKTPEVAASPPPEAVEAPKVPEPEAAPQAPEAAVADVSEAPKVPEAPGVRLDEKAEEEAAVRLEEVRRERKLKKLRKGLAPTRGGFIAKIGALFKAKKKIDESLMEELEEALLVADVGTPTAELLLNVLKDALEKDELSDSDAAWDLLREEVRHVLSVETPQMDVTSDKPYTIMVVGVNGVGKTTTIGKLATQFTDQGHKVVLAAADTFRAAAVNQLEIWGRRAGAEVIKSKEGADPSSVVFDAIKHAKEQNADIVIADTAGRLHTKVPLMEEVKKIGRVMGKAHENAPHDVLLVLDATTGQNAISQVAMFKEAVNISGLVVTKLDGTAKGGVIIGICQEHGLPIRFIGIGEAKDDLRHFEVDDFVQALFWDSEDQEDQDEVQASAT